MAMATWRNPSKGSVTTNLHFGEWTEVFGPERLTHHVHILEMNGESYRLKRSRETVESKVPDGG